MTETTTDNTTLGQAVKTQIRTAEKALLDITDIAGILRNLAAANLSSDGTIEATQIDLLARVLEDRAEAIYDVVSTTANWAPEARAVLYAVPGMDEGEAA
jgi:hypothetical protein